MLGFESYKTAGYAEFGSYKTAGCAECKQEMKKIPEWVLAIESVGLAILFCFIIVLAVSGSMATMVFIVFSIVAAGILSLAYAKHGRRVFIYTFKDSKGRWHTHLDEPQKKCGAHICMADFTLAEDMIIKEPILKIQVRGWGRKRHEILNGNFGNWELSDFRNPLGSVNEGGGQVIYPFNLTLDNGTTRQKKLPLDWAYRIIQSRYQPVCALAEYDAYELAYLREIATSYEVMRAVTGDIIELIEQWRGSSESKIGMSSRIMLERLRQCAAVNIHDPGETIRAALEKKIAEPKQILLNAVTWMIATEAVRSRKLRDFVAAKPQYLPPDEKPADAAGEAKAS